MKAFSSRHYKCLFIAASLVLLLALTLSACNSASSTTTTTTSRGRASNSVTTTTGPAPQVKRGTQPCPEAVKDPSYWDPIIATQVNVSKVESVICGNLVGNSSLQALISVRYYGKGQLLDVYVYNNITDPSPTQIFKLQNLYKGNAKVSAYNTLLTAEVDQNSSLNKHVSSNAALTQDLFREFQWSHGAGTLIPVAFPGIFPDLTRYQAETAQAAVNQGHQPWRLSATQTAQALAAQLLHWKPNAPTSILSGGGNSDLNAVVTVKSTNPGSGTITVVLSRLEGNSNGGIWEATSITSPDLSISVPQDRDLLTSPTTVKGTGNAFEGRVGKVIVLDHLYTDIGHTEAMGAAGDGSTTFSTSLTYNSTFNSGIQEGVVALYSYSNTDGSISGAAMVKEMLD
ncbi:MAG: Gmad2 immunoglobulin-like domain-containing protein [Ktedonobacteraceae bacterium]